jgi:inhibitor of KinA
MRSVTDVVPTFRSLTVHFDPWADDAAALGRQLLAMAQEGQQTSARGRQWLLPVCFDDDFAPDLPRVCELRQLSRAEVTQQLLGASFRVYMLGFQPGFPYMGGLPPTLVTPRLPSPRQKVPAKSVAIALDMCSVYPWESPGGWNLLGRTPVVLFDPAQTAQPAMLAAGDEVRWTAVDRATHDRLAREIADGLPREIFLNASAT